MRHASKKTQRYHSPSTWSRDECTRLSRRELFRSDFSDFSFLAFLLADSPATAPGSPSRVGEGERCAPDRSSSSVSELAAAEDVGFCTAPLSESGCAVPPSTGSGAGAASTGAASTGAAGAASVGAAGAGSAGEASAGADSLASSAPDGDSTTDTADTADEEAEAASTDAAEAREEDGDKDDGEASFSTPGTASAASNPADAEVDSPLDDSPPESAGEASTVSEDFCRDGDRELRFDLPRTELSLRLCERERASSASAGSTSSGTDPDSARFRAPSLCSPCELLADELDEAAAVRPLRSLESLRWPADEDAAASVAASCTTRSFTDGRDEVRREAFFPASRDIVLTRPEPDRDGVADTLASPSLAAVSECDSLSSLSDFGSAAASAAESASCMCRSAVVEPLCEP